MGRKRKYPNMAAKQKAYRIRKGQKRKVSIEIRRGEDLGSGKEALRAKKEDETWDEYHKYLQSKIPELKGLKLSDIESDSHDARRSTGKYIEPTFSEDYYERRRQHEQELKKERRKKIRNERGTNR